MAMRVLWVTTVADVDGPGRVLSALLSRWPAGDTHAVCALRSATASFRRAIPDEVQVVELGMWGTPDLRVWSRLRRICRAWRPDLLHTQLSRADWIGRAVGRSLGVPIVSTLHNVHSRMYPAEFSAVAARIGQWFDRVTLPWADRLIAVSEGVRADLLAHHPDRQVTVVPNGLDFRRAAGLHTREAARREWGIGDEEQVVGSVARLTVQKGVQHLVEAARLVCARLPRARFVHMGSGPLAGDVAGQVSAAGIADRFTLLGHIDDPMLWLPGFDLFALSSEWEGMPIALLEAMAAGIPSVGTRVAGIDEVIEHNRSGVLVPPADPPALAGAIIDLFADDERRRAIGRAGRERVGGFDAAAIALRYRDVFLGAAAAAGRGR